ncbi:uncharacterized protein V1516DRAFT_672121 [Lipomyces oligophaga]|uniref:uncharacterized protein n=1 Tax=Lipomyces oligophaga TaxID=45792 RepID=UPI0034CD6CFE
MSRIRNQWRKKFQSVSLTDYDSAEEDGEFVYLDEQQQDELISSLREENEIINKRYKVAFTTISLLQTPIFLFHPALYYDGADAGHFLTFSALTSFLVSAYVIHKTPVSPSEFAAVSPSIHIFGKQLTQQQLLIVLNAILSSLIAVLAFIKFSPLLGIDYLWFSPLGCLLSVLLVRGWMQEGDVDGLEKFRYKYKGA